jgi:tight adherence protein B
VIDLNDSQLTFVLLVFGAVVALAYALFVPTVGVEQQTRRRLRKRLSSAAVARSGVHHRSLLRDKYLKQLNPLERVLESLPGMEALGRISEQAGRTSPAYRILVWLFALGASAGVVVLLATRVPLIALGAALLAGVLPILKVQFDRNKRMARFEEQFPEALDTITRALKAGHPFSETLNLVGTEMDAPIAVEFEATFNDLNYGSDARTALLNLLERVPSVSVMAFVSSVLIQRESGGNLAEILAKLSAVIRSRFRFQRRVRTLSAEGRMSAWILALVPFVLFAGLYLTTPSYLEMLTSDPLGRQLISGAFVLLIIGLFWMRRVIRIQA